MHTLLGLLSSTAVWDSAQYPAYDASIMLTCLHAWLVQAWCMHAGQLAALLLSAWGITGAGCVCECTKVA